MKVYFTHHRSHLLALISFIEQKRADALHTEGKGEIPVNWKVSKGYNGMLRRLKRQVKVCDLAIKTL